MKEHLARTGVDVGALMANIKSIVVKTFLSVQPFVASACTEQVPFRYILHF